MRQQCRRGAPQVFPVLTREGPVPFTAFPALPPSGEGCGEHQTADATELAGRQSAEFARRNAESAKQQAAGPRLVTP